MSHSYNWRPTARYLGALALLCAVMLAWQTAFAQNQDATNPSQPQAQQPPPVPDPLSQSDQQTGETTDETSVPVVSPLPAAADEAATSDSGGTAQDAGAPVYSLQTGLPLTSRMSPLHWGHLSLLAVNLLEAYQAEVGVPSATATLGSGLVIYSVERSRWRLNFQYMPMAWYTSGRLQKSLTAHAANFSMGRRIGRDWRVDFADEYHYSPNLSFMAGPSFNPDFSTGSATRNPFFLAGRQALVNTAVLDVHRELSSSDSLNASVSQSFARLSQYTNIQSASANNTVPADEELFYMGQLSWSHKFNANGAMWLSYGYTNQQERNYNQRFQSQSATAGYSRKLKPTVTASVEAGPAWSKRVLTAQGSVSVFKSFLRGGLAVSAARDTQFVGVLGGTYHNRFDVSASHRLWTRWDFQVGSSYVQQHLGGSPHSGNGQMSWAALSYRITPSWSAYSSYYFFRFGSNVNIPRESEAAVLGIRWAWSPETSGR